MLKHMRSLFIIFALSLITGVASAWVQFIPLVIDAAGIGLSIYDIAKGDELSDKARAQIERSLKRQLDLGLQPLHVIDARTREMLGAQGRIELGIDQLSARLDQWGDQLLSGQGALSEQLDALAQESRDGHAMTRSLLKHMLAGELSSGLRNLSDAVEMFKRDPSDAVARQMLASAKSTLVKHIEFLRAEERAGRPTPVEHWALLRLSLTSCYLGLGSVDSALAEAEKLIALPVQAEGMTRLYGELPAQIKEGKVKFFDKKSPTLERRVNGLVYVELRLKAWSASLSDERDRLNTMKRRLIERISSSAELKARWATRVEGAKARATKREDELAMKAFMALSAEFARAQKPKAPCASSAGGCPGVAWVTVKGGSFMMGSDDGDSDEKPIHRVSVSEFRIAESEVTVRQYRGCVEAGVCTQPETGRYCTWGKSGYDDHPINCVDWGQARTFSRWVGGDLPTEAQWEYAARGGERFKYSGSDDADSVGWSDSNSGSSTHPVKRKRENGYGLYDMSGNVWEWTLDERHSGYSGAPSSGDQAWGDVPTCSKVCDTGSSRRVVRGGSWDSYARYLRVAYRHNNAPDNRRNYLGFRPAGPIP